MQTLSEVIFLFNSRLPPHKLSKSESRKAPNSLISMTNFHLQLVLEVCYPDFFSNLNNANMFYIDYY